MPTNYSHWHKCKTLFHSLCLYINDYAIFIIVLLYLELTFHLFIYGKIGVISLIPALFSIVYGTLFQLAFLGMTQRIYVWTSRILIGIIGFVYMIQFFYYKIFQTFLSIYSLGAVGLDVTQFLGIIFDAIKKYKVELLGFLLPIVLFWIFIKEENIEEKKIRDKNITHTKKLIYPYVATLGISCSIILILMAPYGRGQNTPYTLYYKDFAMDKGVKTLGLLTSVRKNIEETFGQEEGPYISLPLIEQASIRGDISSLQEENSGDKNNILKEVLGENSLENRQVVFKESQELAGEDELENKLKEEVERMFDFEPNSLDYDFNELASLEQNKQVRQLHEYFSYEVPTLKNKYTGMFEGYNLIMITAEGFAPYAIHEEVTPTLYKLSKEGFVFENFYTPLWWASTIDGEYVATTSLLPKQGVISFNKIADNYLPYALGTQFSSLGYESRAYHNHSYKYYKRHLSHPNLGYDYKGVGNGLEIEKLWPSSDHEMMEVSILDYRDSSPFHTYYMTISGHMNYSFTGNNMSSRHKEKVSHLPFSDPSKAYIACNIELDLALEKLIEELEAQGILENTVIAISADHYPYGLDKSNIDEIVGHKVEQNFELYENNFILWSGGMEEPIIVEKVGSSLDIIPTLSNLFNLSYDSRLFMGKDLLSNSESLVIFANGSFIDNKVKYNASNGNIEFLTDEIVDKDYIKYMEQVIKNKFLVSSQMVELDYYRYLTAEE